MFFEEHPIWYHSVPEMRVLILGTYPPLPKKRSFEFYYPNPQNRFWEILAQIANMEITENSGPAAVEQRKRIMEHLRVGVQNIGRTIERLSENSSDKDLIITNFQDLLGIIDAHETLNAILLTGFTGKSSTYHSFIKYLEENKVSYTPPEKPKPGYSFSISSKRTVKCIIGNSTSRAARRVTTQDLVTQFKRAIEEGDKAFLL